MLIQREVQRRYNTLLEDVKTKEYYTGVDLTNRVNCYTCRNCQHITKTIDLDAGVTPFMHKCEKCNGMAGSSFFKDIAPEKEPTQEWYRPELKEVLKLRNNNALLEHVLKGGLLLRNVKK